MLENFYSGVEIRLPQKPLLPSAQQRSFWETLPDGTVKQWVDAAEKLLDYPWPPILATDFLDYRRTGSRVLFTQKTDPRRSALHLLTLAECARCDGRFLDQIVNGIWAFCDEATWTISAHCAQYPVWGDAAPLLPDVTQPQARYIDILGSDVGAQLACVHALLGETLRQKFPTVDERLVHQVRERLLEPFVQHDDYPWMGGEGPGVRYVNNWTIWIVSNVLAAAQLTCDDESLCAAVVEKAARLIDRFLLTCTPDGGYPEGSQYWGIACGALVGALQSLCEMTGGKADFLAQEKVQKLCEFLPGEHIGGKYFADHGDASVTLNISARRVYTVGRCAHSPLLTRFGLALRAQTADDEVLEVEQGFLRQPLLGYRGVLLLPQFSCAAPEKFPFTLNNWFASIEVLCARQQQETDRGMVLCAKMGTSCVPHSHFDVGSFLLYSDGKPGVIDPGWGEYNAANFGPDRGKLPAVSSAWHSAPYIAGCTQAMPADLRSRRALLECRAQDTVCTFDEHAASLCAQLAPVYPQAPVNAWQRSFLLDRTDRTVTVTDTYDLADDTAPSWFCFITANRPVQTQDGLRIPVCGGRDLLAVLPLGTQPVVDCLTARQEAGLTKAWNGEIWRVRLPIVGKQGSFCVKFHQLEDVPPQQ